MNGNIYINKSNIIDNTDKILKILSSTNEYELIHTNKLNYFKIFKNICQQNYNLKEYSIDKIELPQNYNYIINSFTERLNIIKENIKYCDIELQKLIS